MVLRHDTHGNRKLDPSPNCWGLSPGPCTLTRRSVCVLSEGQAWLQILMPQCLKCYDCSNTPPHPANLMFQVLWLLAYSPNQQDQIQLERQWEPESGLCHMHSELPVPIYSSADVVLVDQHLPFKCSPVARYMHLLDI